MTRDRVRTSASPGALGPGSGPGSGLRRVLVNPVVDGAARRERDAVENALEIDQLLLGVGQRPAPPPEAS